MQGEGERKKLELADKSMLWQDVCKELSQSSMQKEITHFLLMTWAISNSDISKEIHHIEKHHNWWLHFNFEVLKNQYICKNYPRGLKLLMWWSSNK